MYSKYLLLELMTAWIVILWRFAATYVCAKHMRADSGADTVVVGLRC